MRNTIIAKFLTTILLFGVGLYTLTNLASCDNFLNSGNLREDIQNAIDYNNAATCTVYLKADADKGDFLSDGEKTFKIDYNSEVQFSVNLDSYVFKGLEAVSRSDPNISRSDCVQFTIIYSDEKKGIYNINIKILKEASDILIRPVCIPLPKLTEITPKFESTGCDQDTTISFTFNKEVKPESFKDENGTYSCISIYCDDGDLSSNFSTPYFSTDNKTLYIPANSQKLILPPDGTKNLLNIEVKYDFSNACDIDGNKLNTTGVYQYKINKNFGNQRKVIVHVESDTDYGKFLSSGEKECTEGYTIEVQFTVKKDEYKFLNFEAVSTGASHESRSDCVVFEDLEKDDDGGIYKARVRVVEGKSDILIRPLCQELPKVTELSPKMESAGCDQDTVIAISFNKEMNPKSFTDSKGKYTCIKISSFDGDDLSPYFSSPTFSSDNRTLYITPLAASDTSKLILPPDQAKNTLGIKVQYDFSEVKDSQGLSLTPLAQSGSHEYKINKSYGKQKIAKLQIDTDISQGKFLSSGEKDCYLGYTLDIQFTLKKTDYVFKDFEAVSSKDGITSLADSVSFEEKEYDDDLGLYKAKVRLIKDRSDILIRAKCSLIPKLASISPEFNSSGINQDSEIQISFNKPVNPQTFGNYSCITISSGDGDDLSPYFASPYFSLDNKTLYIRPLGANNNSNLLLPPESSKNTMNIRLQYDFSNIKDFDGLTLTESGSHEYKIKKEFENQKTVNVSMGETSDAEYGSFFPSGNRVCVLDYDTSLQFTVNNEKYKFIGLKTNHPESISLTLLGDPTNEIYKYNLRVTAIVDDILIQPVCLLRPAITSTTPAVNDKKFTNTPIEITFNQQMEAEDVNANDSIFKYGADSISISYGEYSLNDYFEAPVFTAGSNKTKLILRPKETRLNDFMENQKLPFVDIKVSFGEKITVTKDGQTMPLVAGSDFTVSYKAAVESDPPRIMDFFFTHDNVSLTSTVKDAQRFSNKVYTGDSSFNAEDVISNFTYDGVFYIWGYFYDSGVGVKTVTIKKQRTHKNATKDAGEIALDEEAVSDTRNVENYAEFISDENGKVYFCKKIDLSQQEPGIYRFDIDIADGCGNTVSPKPVSVIYRKDFLEDSSFTKDYYPFNRPLKDDYNSKAVYIYTVHNGQIPQNCSHTKICGNLFVLGNYNQYISYKNKDNELVTEKFTEIRNDGYYLHYQDCFYHPLDVEKVAGLDFTLSITAAVNGKETLLGKRDYSFPKEPIIASVGSDNKPVLYAPEGATGKFTTKDDGIYIYSEKQYSEFPIYSDFLGPYNFNGEVTSNLQAPAIRGVEYSKSAQSECFDLKITLDENWKDSYDCISLDCTYPMIGEEYYLGIPTTTGYKDKKITTRLFDGNKNVITASIPVKSLFWFNKESVYENFRNDIIYSISGTKDSVTKTTESYCITPNNLDSENKKKCDNLPPQFLRIQGAQNDKLIVSISDMESGIKSATARMNGKTYQMAQSVINQSFFDALIPYEDLLIGNNVIEVTATDNADNTTSGSVTAKYQAMPIANQINNDSSSWKLDLQGSSYGAETPCLLIFRKIAFVYFYDFDTSSQVWNQSQIESYTYYDIDTSYEGHYSHSISFFPGYRNSEGRHEYPYEKRDYSISGSKFVKVLLKADTPYFEGNADEYGHHDNKEYSTRTSMNVYRNYEIYYTGYGSERGSGNYNVLYKNGTSKESVVVASDAPVYIHTLVTNSPYSEAKDFTRAQWECRDGIGTKQINFTTGNHDPIRYNIPTNQIQSGQCYVVIAHYADDSVLMSEVMVK